MIAFLIRDLNVRGGTHKQFLKLIEYAASQGEPFYIITMELDLDRTYPGFRKYAHHIRVFEPEKKARSILARYGRWRRNCARLAQMLSDASVANIHDSGFEYMLPAFKNVPTVWQINDLNYSFRVGCTSDKKDSWRKWRNRRYIMHGLPNVDAITVNVTKNAERVLQCMHRRAEVLYCGIEPIGIHADMAETMERFEAGRINLLSSGVWFEYRNYEAQIEAVRLLAEKGYDVRLDIIGMTDYSPRYVDKVKRMISDYNLSDRITVCGMVDEAVFRRLHEQADIFLFVNIDQSWGLSVFEAMSCGLPVIVSSSVGATEILHDGVDSLFVNPRSPREIADRVEMLVRDSKLYHRISDVASVFHHDYTWDKSYSAPMLKILRRLSKV